PSTTTLQPARANSRPAIMPAGPPPTTIKSWSGVMTSALSRQRRKRHNKSMAGELGGHALKDALVILGAAGVVIPAFARLKISPVIGFIIVGMIVGPFGLGALAAEHRGLDAITITDREGIEPFAEFGIILLLFAIGLDLSFRRLAS